MTISDYRIAAGYNVALGSLVNIERIKPTNDQYFFAPYAIGSGSPGQKKVKLNGPSYRSGYPSVDWVFGVLTRVQYEYLKTTYCGGGFTGEVTIYTTVSGNSYSRYNAVIDVPPTIEIQNSFYAPHPVVVHMTHLIPL